MSARTPTSDVAGSVVRLADRTTLRVGGPAAEFVDARTTDEFVDAVRDADHRGMPVLVLGGGSNLLVGDDGFDGRVVAVGTRGVKAWVDSCSGATVTAAAGEPWDPFVEKAVASGWVGVEALSGIPGQVGATPIQNVGAYGQDVAATVAAVRTWDRAEDTQRTFAAADCGFGYRDSRFKAEPGRYLILDVTFVLRLGELGDPLRYVDLVGALGVGLGGRARPADVRAAVLDVRAGKGMVLDPDDHDTWSAGSFFTNPVLSAQDAARLPAEAPRWPADDGRVKTSAAWLIEHAGFARGHRFGTAALSGKHALALTNRGGASSADLIALAREIRGVVAERFDVRLEPEPVLVGVTL